MSFYLPFHPHIGCVDIVVTSENIAHYVQVRFLLLKHEISIENEPMFYTVTHVFIYGVKVNDDACNHEINAPKL